MNYLDIYRMGLYFDKAHLRIGNIVKYHHDWGVVDHVFNESDFDYFDRIGPNLITIDALICLGFTDITELSNTDIKEYRMFNYYDFCIQFPVGIEAHCYVGNYPVALKYVHELQNLFFSLKKKEITYNIP